MTDSRSDSVAEQREALGEALCLRDYTTADRLIAQGIQLDDVLEETGISYLHHAAHAMQLSNGAECQLIQVDGWCRDLRVLPAQCLDKFEIE
ncbi:MAG: hypothetical protein ABIG44_03170 [Planctomycetota bacterium]